MARMYLLHNLPNSYSLENYQMEPHCTAYNFGHKIVLIITFQKIIDYKIYSFSIVLIEYNFIITMYYTRSIINDLV